MSFKVCEVVSAHELIPAGEDDGKRGTSQPAHRISPTSITESDLHIFRLFLKRWIQLMQSYNCVFQSMNRYWSAMLKDANVARG